jgi:hypothetical protein
MSTYIASTLGCLTALALVAYLKECRARYYRRESIFKRKRDDYYGEF